MTIKAGRERSGTMQDRPVAAKKKIETTDEHGMNADENGGTPTLYFIILSSVFILFRSVLVLLFYGDGRLFCTGEPRFRLTGGARPTQRRPAQGRAIAETLNKAVGTPDNRPYRHGVPLTLERSNIRPGRRGMLKETSGPVSPACAACHGTSGTARARLRRAQSLSPAISATACSKYTSTPAASNPSAADLERPCSEGLPGTAHASFRKLPDRERTA